MAWQGIGSNCLTCARPMGHNSLSVQNEENRSISDALRKHFWFKEDEFQGATICQMCWNNVNHFHQFYILVEEVYHMHQVSLIIKSESEEKHAGLEEWLPETSAHDFDVDMQRHGSFVSVKEEPALEIVDEHGSDNERPMNENKDLSGIQYCQRDFLNDHVQVDCKPKSFSYRYALDRHMKTLHETRDERKFKCDQCPRSFPKQYERVRHMKSHRMRYHCSECPSKFRNGNALIAHVVKTHPGTSPFRCPFCQRIFNSYRELHKHERSVHPGEWQKTRMSSQQAPAATIQNCSEQNKPELSGSVEKPQNEDDFLAQHVKFICKQCAEQTPSFTLYVEHCSFAHGHKLPSIECCGQQFATKASLYQHVQVVSNFRCKLCSMAFSVKNELKRHVNEEHFADAETFKCYRCSKLFDNRRMYRQHLHSHRQNIEDDHKPRYVCADCPDIFRYGSHLRDHIADVHPGVTPYRCPFCNKTFSKSCNMVRHIDTLHPNEMLEEQERRCHMENQHPAATSIEYSSDHTDEKLLLDHVDIVHPESSSPYERTLNPETEPNENSPRNLLEPISSLLSHPEEMEEQPSSSQQSPVLVKDECLEESQPEISDNGINDRKLKRKNIDDLIAEHVKFICKQCGKQSPNFKLFVEHSSVEHGNEHPSVDCCGIQFFKRYYLYKHVQFLNNAGIFRCEICSKTFNYKFGLKRHMLSVHATKEDLKYKCTRCPRSFGMISIYRTHIKKHLARKESAQKLKYLCADCPKILSSGKSLKDHVTVIHPGITPYKCPFCKKSFIRANNMARHVKTMHPIELQGEIKRRCHMENVHPTPPFIKYSNDLSDEKLMLDHVDNVHPGSSSPYERTVIPEKEPNENSPRNLLEPISSLLSHPEELEEQPTSSQQSPVVVKDECLEESQPEISEKGGNDRMLKRKNIEDLIAKHVKFICKQCGKQSPNFKLFVEHSSVEHGNEHPSVDCCGKQFIRKFYLYQHVQFLNNADIFRCKICLKTFNYKFGLKRHMLSVHATKEDLKYKCTRCPRSFGMISIYRTHIKNHLVRKKSVQNLRYPCANCPNILSSAKSLKYHVTAFHPGITPYKCPFCTRTFLRGSNMARHVKTMHPLELQGEIKRSHVKNRPLKYPCTECSSEFNIGRLLTDHVLNVHPGKSPFKCPFCKRKFNNYIELHKHERAVHPDEWQRVRLSSQQPREETTENCLKVSDPEITETEPEMSDNEQEMSESEQYSTTKEQYQQEEDDYIVKHTQLSCKQCGEKSPSFTMLLKHSWNVHGNKSVSIECCGKKFDSKSRLYEHVQIVNDPNIFRCKLCLKVYSIKYRFKQHMKQVHGTKDEKKFKCDQCPRSFAMMSMFKQHYKRHQVRKQQQMFLCADCPKIFNHGCDLKKHLTTVHPEVIPYKCAFCKKLFSRSSNMARHVETLHPSDLQEKLKRSPPSAAIGDDECLEESQPESSECPLNLASQQQETLALVKEEPALDIIDESEREESSHSKLSKEA